MIEMLGVLAVVGILSAGGIMGYSVAMENYRVNKFVDDMAKAVGALQNIYIKEKVDFNYNSNHYSMMAEDLCKFGVFPKNSSYCQGKTPWEGGGQFSVVSQRSTSDSAIIDNEGNLKRIRGLRSFLNLFGLNKLNYSLCVKILTANWENVSPVASMLYYVKKGGKMLDGSVQKRLPITMSLAENFCLGINNTSDFIYLRLYFTGTIDG